MLHLIKKLLGLDKPKKSLRQLALMLAIFGPAHIAFPRYVVATGSMEPTIPIGSHVIACRIPVWFSDPAAGDIVVFKPEQGVSEFDWVHRIIGLPEAPVKELARTRSPKSRRDISIAPSIDEGVIATIPKGYFYQAGDSPTSFHGLVPREKIIARVIFHFRLPWKTRAGSPQAGKI